MQSIITRYSNLSGNIDLVFKSLCALISEQPHKVDWTDFKSTDWTLLEKLAVGEGVAPMAFYLLQNHPDVYHLTIFNRHTYQVFSEREAGNAIRNAVLLKNLGEIIQKFQEEEIPIVLIKGADLAKSLYPQPGLRWMTDLDLLVSKRNIKQTLLIAQNLGYREYIPEAFPGIDRFITHHTHMIKEGTLSVLLELHWSLVGGEAFRYSVPMDWFWHNLESPHAWGGKINLDNDINVYALNPTANLLYLAAHQMLQHGGEMASLHWLLDMDRLIRYRGNEIDWKSLVNQADMFGWSAALGDALKAVGQIFNTRLPDGVYSNLQAQKGANDALVELKSKQAPTHILLEWKKLSSLTWKARLLLIYAQIFPTPAYMRWRYDPKPVWIWPIYYIFRLLGIFRDGVSTIIIITIREISKSIPLGSSRRK